MSVSLALTEDGHPPEMLETNAVVTFVPGTGITKVALSVTGRVAGLDEEQFREAAERANEGCPVSRALAGVGEITLEATLEP
jgi:osmotically inducible protein OsmC